MAPPKLQNKWKYVEDEMQSQINVLVSSVFIDSLHLENIPLLFLSCFDSGI